MKTQFKPASYIPTCPDDFVGPARVAAKSLAAMCSGESEEPIKLLLYGPPGVGKTRLAEMFASRLTGERISNGQSFNVESVNGRNVDLELVRRWQYQSRFKPINWRVYIVNELDTCHAMSQDLLLTFLDEMPRKTALFGTSNLKTEMFTERFHSRFIQWKVESPGHDEITLLLRKWKIPKAQLDQIAVGCGGNVRAALLDAQAILQVEGA